VFGKLQKMTIETKKTTTRRLKGICLAKRGIAIADEKREGNQRQLGSLGERIEKTDESRIQVTRKNGQSP